MRDGCGCTWYIQEIYARGIWYLVLGISSDRNVRHEKGGIRRRIWRGCEALILVRRDVNGNGEAEERG